MASETENRFEEAMTKAKATLKADEDYQHMSDGERQSRIMDLADEATAEAGVPDYVDDAQDQLLTYSRDELGLGVSG